MVKEIMNKVYKGVRKLTKLNYNKNYSYSISFVWKCFYQYSAHK